MEGLRRSSVAAPSRVGVFNPNLDLKKTGRKGVGRMEYGVEV